jgi:hypothetical protein
MTITVEGIYQGKNLYVQNPFSSSGVGFCVYEVRVNGQVTTDEISSSAFEIDLRYFNLKLGDPVAVLIYHKDGCTPKVLNPEVLKPKSTFEATKMDVAKTATGYELVWETKNENGSVDFVIQQYKWNKWNQYPNTVAGKGTNTPNTYRANVLLNTGQNQFRVSQVDYTGQPRISRPCQYSNPAPAISFSPKKADKEIVFSALTDYEIYDKFGDIVKKGQGNKVDVSALPKGGYYLNYDNQADEFVKI